MKAPQNIGYVVDVSTWFSFVCLEYFT